MMKKSFYFLALLMGMHLAFPWVTQAQTTITIGDGTSTTYYPLPGYYGWQYDVYIYTPTDAEELGGNISISTIGFDVSSSSTSTGASWEIWMKDVDASDTLAASTTFADFTNNATLVYSNTAFSSTTGWNTFNLSEEFTHEGGKALLVIVRGVGCGTSGGCSRQCYYTTAAGAHWYKRQDSSDPGTGVAGSIDGYRANIQMTYEETIVDPSICRKVKGLAASEINSTGATLTWIDTNNASATYDVELIHGTDTQTVATNLSGYTFTFDTLSSNTVYSVRVRAVCAADNTTAWSTVSFRTACAAVATGWSTDFEDENAGAAPMCWTNLGGTTNVVSNDSHTRNGNCLKFSGSLNNMIVLPETEDEISNLQVRFWTRPENFTNSNCGKFYIGYVTDDTLASSFVALDSLCYNDIDEIIEMEVPMIGAPSGSRMAFRHVPTSTAWYWFVDDVVIENIPTCVKVSSLTVTDTGVNDVTLAWTDEHNNDATYTIYNMADTTVIEEGISLNEYQVTGLQANKLYTFGVAVSCTDGETSNFRTVKVRTSCGTIELPFTEDFETFATGTSAQMPCWSRGVGGGSTIHPYVNTASNNKYLYFAVSSTIQFGYIVLPEMDASVDISSLVLSFDARKYNSTTASYGFSELLIVAADTDGYAPTAAFDTLAVMDFTNVDWQRFEISLDNYTGNYHRIALVAPYGAAVGRTNYVYLDNLDIRVIPTCPKPTLAISDLSDASATLNINDSSTSSNYVVYLSHLDTNNHVVTDTVDTDDTEVELTGLIANTEYTVNVVSTCADGTVHYPVSTVFRTLCSDIATEDLPWTDNFEDYSGGTSASATYYMGTGKCYTVASQYSANYPYVYSSSTYAASGTKSLYLAGTATAPTVMALPHFSADLQDLMLSFKMRTAALTYEVTVGVMTDPSDANTFVPVRTFSNTVAATYETFEVVFPGVEEGYIAFRSASSSSGIYIDDLKVEAPSCFKPMNVHMTDRSEASAIIAWESMGESFSYEYGDTNFVLGAGISGSTNDSFAELSGLSPRTPYDFYVWTECGNGTSDTIKFTFNTTASPVTEFPYTTGFEADDDNGEWEFFNGTQVNKWFIDTAVNYTAEGNQALYISNDNGASNAYTTGQDATVYAARAFSVAQDAGYTVSFDWRTKGESTYDYLRAFIVPVSANLTAGTLNTGLTATGTPEGWLPLGGKLNLIDSVQHQDSNAFLTAGNYYLLFAWHNDNSSGTQPPASVDNVVIDLLSCYTPANIHITSIDNESVTIAWEPRGEETEWAVYDNDEMQVVQAPEYTASVEGGETHTFKVMAVCGEGDSSFASSPISVLIPMAAPATLPYATGFEDGEDVLWDIYNGTETNKWYIDTAVARNGNYSLYISNDSAVSNSYSNSTSVVFATRNFVVTDSAEYSISFDWRAHGESTYDYLRACLVPFGTQITPGTLLSTTMTGYVDLNSKLNLSDEWTSFGKIVVLKPGVYTIVLTWRNDPSVQNNPPAAVDNIEIRQVTCPAPDSLVVSDITANSATIAWAVRGEEQAWAYRLSGTDEWVEISDNPYTIEGLVASSSYVVELRAVCGDDDQSMPIVSETFFTDCGTITTLPFEEDFEGYATGSSAAFHPCWDKGYYGSGTTTYPYVSTASSNKYMYFYSTSSYTMEYLILPEMDATIPMNTLEITFDAHKTSSSTSAHLIVAAISGSTFNLLTPYDTLKVLDFTNNDFENFDVDLTDYTGTKNRIAFLVPYNSTSSYIYLDNISIHNAPSCGRVHDVVASNITSSTATLSWTAREGQTQWLVYLNGVLQGTATSTTYPLTGLDATTDYTVSVRALCSTTDTSVATSTSFTTLCATITDLPWSENFDNLSSMTNLDCWDRYSGLFDDVTGTASLTSTTSGWNTTTTAMATKHAKINIYGTTIKYWLVTPYINIADHASLHFDLALTDYSNADAPEGIGPDDRFMVLVTTDGGTTWSVLEKWTSDSTNGGRIYGNISLTGETVDLSLNSFSGSDIRIAFYGESTVSNNDNDLHIDNIVVDTTNITPGPGPQPQDTCNAPVIANATSEQGNITITWSGDAASYEVAAVKGAWNNPAAESVVTGHIYTFENLEIGSSYTVGVRAVCGNARSTWATRSVMVVGIDGAETVLLGLYPNPATVSVTLELGETSNVTIVDATGRKVVSQTMNEGKNVVDLDGYAAGAYYVRVTGATGTAVRKLVIR